MANTYKPRRGEFGTSGKHAREMKTKRKKNVRKRLIARKPRQTKSTKKDQTHSHLFECSIFMGKEIFPKNNIVELGMRAYVRVRIHKHALTHFTCLC